MIANDQTTEPSRRFSIPWNITEWLEQPALLAGIKGDIYGLDWTNPELTGFLRANPRYQPRFLLTLLTQAYAQGVCESEEVCDLYHRDAAQRALFPDPMKESGAILCWERLFKSSDK